MPRGGARSTRRYPRTARVNESLREILADELRHLVDVDPRLAMLTITAVETDPDLRHATVMLASLPEPAAEALAEARVRLQAAIGRQVRLKRTPLLSFIADPAIAAGQRVEELLRGVGDPDDETP